MHIRRRRPRGDTIYLAGTEIRRVQALQKRPRQGGAPQGAGLLAEYPNDAALVLCILYRGACGDISAVLHTLCAL